MSKTQFLVTILMMVITTSFAQTISYQGVARNAQGAPLANTPIAVRLSINNAQTGGSTFYTETKTATTNGFGLYTISINDGSGNRTGSFSSINWSQPTYIQSEIDPANGTAFTDMGTSLMQSVPSAIVADNLKGIVDPQDGDMLVYRNNQWQKKPEKKSYTLTGPGRQPEVTIGMLSSPVVVNVDYQNAIIRIQVSRAFGSVASGGGTGLRLALGYKRTDIPGQPITPFNESDWINGLRVAVGTRTTFTLSGNYKNNLPVGTYEIGLIGYTGTQAQTMTWNDNGSGIATVEVEY